MNILVTAASRHGATYEIAERLAAVLADHGHRVEVLPPSRVRSLEGFQAVVLGSAVYTGGWLPEARRFTERFADRLALVPLWLFSSGPIGRPPVPAEQPRGVDELVRRTGARRHEIFTGKLDRQVLGLAERLAVRAVKVDPGDFRDWATVVSWGEDIAKALDAEVATASSRP